MQNIIYTVYVQTDANSNITAVNSSAFLGDATGWTQIDEGVGDRYHHAQGNYFDKPICTMDGIPRYKLVEGRAVERDQNEIESDREQLNSVSTPTLPERVSALESATLDNTEMQVDLDYRLTCLALDINTGGEKE